MKTQRVSLSVWLALFSVYIFWGTTYLAIRFAVESIPPFMMAATRFLVAGAILYAWRRLAGDPAPTKRQWRSAGVIGLLLLLGGNGGVVWAEQRVASGIAALMIGTVPLWLVLLDMIRPGGAHPHWLSFVGVLIGFGGVALLIGPALFEGGANGMNLVGLLALLLAAFLWALGSLYSRSAVLPDSPLLGTAMEMLLGGAGLVVASALTGEWARLELASVSQKSFLGLAYLIIFGSLVAFTAYTWLLRVAPTPLVATYAYVNPLVAIALGSFLAQEALTARMIFSAAMIISAVALINTARLALGRKRLKTTA